ncbi:heparinase II/III domain-containing protein [Phycisphaera mikurensis]|uniref:Heparinase II/III-like C-terminal domain-containing protein n=1 Tax=Phycisphaera mikurensis (strain NBRC 102666 / KCTC 22515 / FYK2301M01) TaxID=1142394 RepID=I0ICW7_PHYMF|nr:heparinase II/III family protein [Phycisphaera mikurensis]MBB6442235.1 hypothetical protein [Phycisphaera mikurensis]BAM03105.1 hypothetical protein PSMK_09460 [Phycisphaera mikurensis NBRC 102666]
MTLRPLAALTLSLLSLVHAADQAAGVPDPAAVRGALLEAMRAEAAGLAGEPVYTPQTVAPWRTPRQSEIGNREGRLVDRVADRILVFSELFAAEGDPTHLEEAWRQIEALFDEGLWPDWRDLAHQGDPAGLRTGDLGAALAVAWVRLEADLSPERRAAFREGLDRKVMQPFLASVEKDSWFLDAGTNWTLRIVGGAGMVAAALGDEHPRGEEVRAYAAEKMLAFPEKLGADGSFNEAPGYVEDLDALVWWISFCAPREPDAARRAAMEAAVGRLAATARWNLWVTLAPGRLVAFGDSRPERPGRSVYAAAVAAAARDGVVQWLYLTHADRRLRDPRERVNPRELGWLDASLPPEDPGEALPLATAYRDEGAIVVSRTGWDLSPASTDVVVAAKAGRESNHADHDAGNLTLDVGPHRVLHDLGKPSYPRDYFSADRPRYYTDAPRGHNLLFFGGDDDPLGGMRRGGAGSVASFENAPEAARFALDLSAAYGGDRRVTRQVAHLRPGVVAVLDAAELPGAERVRLRWHLPDGAGLATRTDRHAVVATEAGGQPVTGHLLSAGPFAATAGRHAWAPPFDTARTGEKLEQKHEEYVQLEAAGTRGVAWLSVWLIGDAADTAEPDGSGGLRVTAGGERLHVRGENGELKID